jgi:nicotinate-nucleotide adenylyltransferase
MKDIQQLQQEVGAAFKEAFGRTSLRGRLQDILGEALELQRWTDLQNLQEEAGDLACSVLALFDETGLSMEDAVQRTLEKIERRKHQYHALGRKIKVALLGGAFDPPTLGHVAVAQFVLDSSREFDEVWLVPCHRHMFNKTMTAGSHRLEMLNIATQDDGRVKVCDFEIQNQLGGETYHFLKRLLDSDLAQTHEFSYIIGMDNANHFDRWYNFEELERLVRFVIVPRVGEEPDAQTDWYLKPPHIFLRSDKPLPDTASSVVRAEIEKIIATDGDYVYDSQIDEAVLKMVDPRVYEYVKRNRLYLPQE